MKQRPWSWEKDEVVPWEVHAEWMNCDQRFREELWHACLTLLVPDTTSRFVKVAAKAQEMLIRIAREGNGTVTKEVVWRVVRTMDALVWKGEQNG